MRARLVAGLDGRIPDAPVRRAVFPGDDLYEAEVAYLMRREWAETADDVLWRRTKRGLRLTREEAAGLDEYMTAARGKHHSAAA